MTSLRIFSGGQTGVDRAALDAALERGMPCGGWCPAGRRAEDGPIADKYPLTETAGPDYAERTLANVRDSDATLILNCDRNFACCGAMSAGTKLTVQAAKQAGQPLFVAIVMQSSAGGGSSADVREIAGWIGENNISVLNIAGPRESECPGIYRAAYSLIVDVLTAVHGE